MKNKTIDKKQSKGKKNKNKNKKKHIGKKILIIILLLVVIAGVWFGYRVYKNGGGLSGFLAAAIGHNENTKKNLKEIKVLIMGVSTDIDSELTDTIMVASYNPNTQTANLLSIPRDTYTGTNPSRATASQKLNALYGMSKEPRKTLEAVNKITGLDIKYYVIVRTEGLKKLVDAIGGVNFNVPIDMQYDSPSQGLHINLKAGMQKINGDKAEQLLRWRHSNYNKSGQMTTYPSEYGNDDFGRMRTQRDFIVATAKQTLKPGNIFKIGEILDIANKNIETNLELSFVKDYIPYAVELNADEIKTAVLPGDTPNLNNTNGVSIFVVNKTETKTLIQSMFYTEEKSSDNNTTSNTTSNTNSNTTSSTTSNTNASQIKIELLNGSGDKTKLQQAKKVLENAGYKVTKTGNTSTISKTIITNKKNIEDKELQEIKNTLGVGSTSTNKSSTSLVDVTIVIGKDFK